MTRLADTLDWLRQRKARLIVVAALFAATLLVMTRPEQRPVQLEEKAWRVEAIEVERQALRPTLELFGTVSSPQDATLSSALEAEVVNVTVLDGESIEQGQLLIELDARDAELTLAERNAESLELKAQLQLVQRQLARNRDAAARERELLAIATSRASRAEELFRDRLISVADVESTQENLKRQQVAVSQGDLAVEQSVLNIRQLEAQIARAEAQRDRARLNVERAKITAPFAGVVSEMTVSMGDRVRPGDALMRLQNPALVEVRTQLPPTHSVAVRRGLEAQTTMPAQIEVDGALHPGQLVRIAGRTREGSGGVDSFLRFGNVPAGLRLGSTVRVLLELPEADNAIAVPAEAIYGQTRLYRIVDNRMQMVTVERIGERRSPDGRTDVIVRSDSLQDSDRIVVTKLSNPFDGLLVDFQMIDNGVRLAVPDIKGNIGSSSVAGATQMAPN